MSSTLAEPLSSNVEDSITRLAAFASSTFPVVSVYLNTEPDQHGRTPDVVPYLHREFKALARTFMRSSPELHSFERDAERVLSYAAEKIDRASQGVAIFACWGADEFFEVIQLTTPFGANHVSADNQPHLYGLAEVDERYPLYAAVLADTNTACIYVFGLGQVIGAEQVKGRKVHRVKVGGWSQARYQRRAVNAHHEHAKEVVEHLARIVREDKISHIIFAGDQVVIPLLQEQLPLEMVPMVEVMKIDIHAPEKDVLAATLATLQHQERRTAIEKVEHLLQQYRGRQLAVIRPQETLGALVKGQVEELLISGGMEPSGEQPEDEQSILPLSASDTAEGNAESIAVRQAPMPDLLVTRARQTGAIVTVIEDSALLESVGGVGGFLRWRE
jgi:peptide subunit release factor 1 (eRF1)